MERTVNEAGLWTRRDLLKYAAALAWAAPILAQAPVGEKRLPAQHTGTQLVLLGTQGGPLVRANRNQASNLVIVDDRPYLVDCGYGAVKALVQAGLTLADVSNVFMTHLHDDHTADIPAFLSLKWSESQDPGPAAIYGPYGTAAMVDAAMVFFKANVIIRTIDEGRTVDPKTIFHGHDLDAPRIKEVFKDDRVAVLAVENTHFPERAKAKMDYRSFSYRFNSATRSIVFSGDTAYSENLIELARGADLFVCEVLDPAFQLPAALARGATDNNTESVARHVRETHSSPEIVGKMAAAAKVKTVVLSHQVGGVGDGNNFTVDLRKVFKGEVIVGADQMRL